MKRSIKLIMPFILIGVVILFTGCDSIDNLVQNRKFMKKAVTGQFIDNTPGKLKFKNRLYELTDENIDYKMLDKRIGYFAKNKSEGLYCFIYTIKNTDEKKALAIFNVNKDRKYIVVKVK